MWCENVQEALELAATYEKIVESKEYWGVEELTRRVGFSNSERCTLCSAVGTHVCSHRCEICVWQHGGGKTGFFACVNDNFRDIINCEDRDDFYLLLSARAKQLRAAAAAAAAAAKQC